MAGTHQIVVEAYPFDGATGLVVDEKTSYGWVERLDTSSVGTFPNYTTTYEVSGVTGPGVFRYRWEVSVGETSWLSPLYISPEAITATSEITERLTQAVIAKAARIYALGEAPLGTHGEMTEFGMARVMPDHQITELVGGLLRINWDVDLTSLASVADVVRALGYDDLPTAKDGDIQRAIEAACSWVAEYILGGVAIS
jgi:hypothetical protein